MNKQYNFLFIMQLCWKFQIINLKICCFYFYKNIHLTWVAKLLPGSTNYKRWLEFQLVSRWNFSLNYYFKIKCVKSNYYSIGKFNENIFLAYDTTTTYSKCLIITKEEEKATLTKNLFFTWRTSSNIWQLLSFIKMTSFSKTQIVQRSKQ